MKCIVAAAALAVVVLAPGAASAQDAAAGERVFQSQCRACHQVGENARNGVGPVLNGLIGRQAGTVPNYAYSDANRNSGITWTEDEFRTYIRNPRERIPGTKMVYAGLRDEARVNELLAYLKSFDAQGRRSQ